MRNFDLINFFFVFFNPLGLPDLRMKSSKQFYGRWVWRPHVDATPSFFRLQIAEYQGFHMRYCCVCTSAGFFRILKKAVE